MSGYPVESFVEVPSDDMICSVCQDVLKNPHQCKNGHMNCLSCFIRVIKSKKSCPICNVQVFSDGLSKSQYMNNQIQVLACRCSCRTLSPDNGCEWIGSPEQAEKRLDCPGHYSICLNEGCEKSILVKNMSAHLKKCDKRLVKCKHCKDEIPHCTRSKHEVECKDTSAYCELCDCNVSLSKIETHSSVCSGVEVNCPLTLLGEKCESCSGKVKRIDEIVHLGPNGAAFMTIIKREMLTTRRVTEQVEVDSPRDRHVTHMYSSNSSNTSNAHPSAQLFVEEVESVVSIVADLGPSDAVSSAPPASTIASSSKHGHSLATECDQSSGEQLTRGRNRHFKRKATTSAMTTILGLASNCASEDALPLSKQSRMAVTESSSSSSNEVTAIASKDIEPVVMTKTALPIASVAVVMDAAVKAEHSTPPNASTSITPFVPTSVHRVYDAVKQNRRWASEGLYSGDLVNGRRDGSGRFLFKDHPLFGECEYEGQWSDDCVQGHGTLKYKINYQDRTYTGSFADGEMTGDGRLEYSNGDVYTGEFVGGYHSGVGTMIYANGAKYVGEWTVNEMPSGETRSVKQDYTWGKEVHERKSGNVYEGDFVSDRMEGQGKLTYHRASYGTYEGAFVNGVRKGQGKKVFANGDIFEGGWVEDKMRFGVMKYANGDVYSGRWANNRREGKCVMKWVDGSVFEGQWSVFKQNSKVVKYRNAAGVECDGKWVGGDLIRQGDVCVNMSRLRVRAWWGFESGAGL